MPNTWWLDQDELDDDQKDVIGLPLGKNILITGPPGSGKTNILLLRAQYMTLSDMPNIVILVFARALHDFIIAGAGNYAFPSSKIQTCRSWQRNLLLEHDIKVKLPEKFEDQRNLLIHETKKLIRNEKLTNLYDCILLDEAQDYIPEEIDLFASLAKNIFVVADSRQKIYQGEDSIKKIRTMVDKSVMLRFHYRIGRKICKLADSIAKVTKDYISLESTCNYDEMARPSSVESFKCQDIMEQANRIIEKLRTQLVAYPNEMLAVLCPTKDKLRVIWERIQETDLAGKAAYFSESYDNPFNSTAQIIFCTLHSMKGLEARAVHFAGCEDLINFFMHNRNMTYTAITRAKTSLCVYYSGSLHGYFEKALALLSPSIGLPKIEDLFRKSL
jgi:superfamily I DNA/RNA helicase